jgi:DhnA family fructose-bisphosphate aldolase class Ia
MSELAENLGRFFRPSAGGNRRMMILPVDHGTALPVPELARLDALIERTKLFVDGYVVNYGAARAFAGSLKGKGVCLRTDVYKPAHGANPSRGTYRVFGAEEALRVGAHAVMNLLYLHHPEEDRIFGEAAALISECHRVGLPVILEALPFGIGRPADYTPENIALAVRAAAELGADVVKTAYPGDPETFAEIVASCFVPVIILGGSARTEERAFFNDVRKAIGAGASGVAIGRNVWAHPHPEKMASTLHGIVHEEV